MRKGVAVVLCLLVLGLLAPHTQAVGVHGFTVVFHEQGLPDSAAALVERAGGRVVSVLPALGVLEAEGPASLMTSLGSAAGVLAVAPSLELQLARSPVLETAPVSAGAGADLYELYQWDIKQVTGNGASWLLGTGSHSTVVGIVDSGINTAHPDLAPNLLGGRNFVPDGPDGTVVPGDIEDRTGHGSHVAGAIAGRGRVMGVGPGLGVRVYRVLGASGGAPLQRVAAAIVAAADDGVDVISLSLAGYFVLAPGTWTAPDGTAYRFQDVADLVALQRAVRYAVNRGAVVVAAVGNGGANVTNRHDLVAVLNQMYGPLGFSFRGAARLAPGTVPGVVTVSATGPGMTLASYSNYGPGSVDLTAPGGDALNYPNPGWYMGYTLSAYRRSSANPQTYAWMAGTSMATPKVSAVAALVIDRARAKGEQLTPNQVASRLRQTALDLGNAGFDPWYGHGMVNALGALSAN